MESMTYQLPTQNFRLKQWVGTLRNLQQEVIKEKNGNVLSVILGFQQLTIEQDKILDAPTVVTKRFLLDSMIWKPLIQNWHRRPTVGIHKL